MTQKLKSPIMMKVKKDRLTSAALISHALWSFLVKLHAIFTGSTGTVSNNDLGTKG